MTRSLVLLALATGLLGGCGGLGIVTREQAEQQAARDSGTAVAASPTTIVTPAATPVAAVPAAAPAVRTTTTTGTGLRGSAVAPAQLDQTSAAEKAAAAAPAAAPAGEQSLGDTVASLGDPTQQGFWLKTPLVTAAGKGRVAYGGKSVNVDLMPLGGPAGGGSQLSLPAMQMLGVGLTDLPRVQVYRN